MIEITVKVDGINMDIQHDGTVINDVTFYDSTESILTILNEHAKEEIERVTGLEFPDKEKSLLEYEISENDRAELREDIETMEPGTLANLKHLSMVMDMAFNAATGKGFKPTEARPPNLIEGWDGKIVNKLPGGRYE